MMNCVLKLAAIFPLQITVLHITLALCQLSRSAASSAVPGINVHEVSRSLFSYREDPFAGDDRWSDLSSALREVWTSGHEVLRRSEGVRDVLRVSDDLLRQGISVHVYIQIVMSKSSFSTRAKNRIQSFGSAMYAGYHGTRLRFEVSFASESTYKRFALRNPSDDPRLFLVQLDQLAATLGMSNTIFVEVEGSDVPSTQSQKTTLHLSPGRTLWTSMNLAGRRDVSIARLLKDVEVTAGRFFAPFPLYYPLPPIQDLKVELIAYTPGHEHRAPWLEAFGWDVFKRNLRGMALQGQRLRFYSSQINADCKSCSEAFSSIQNPSRSFVKKAVSVLNGGKFPNETWASGFSSRRTPATVLNNGLRLYVLDTSLIPHGTALDNLEKNPLHVFPGMGVIIFRSSGKKVFNSLQTYLERAFLASVHGISEPELYTSWAAKEDENTREEEPSAAVFDIVGRNVIRSITEQRLGELQDIVKAILYFDVDPRKSLGESEYAKLYQRMNVMLYKLHQAQQMAAGSSDEPAGLYLALSTRHDIKAIRSALDLDAHTRAMARFRDPTLRCHFSRLKREALRASQIFESRYPNIWNLAAAILSFSLTFFTMPVLWDLSMRRKRQRKLH